ncbi:agamous-like MADS-box protein AGL80 [Humulus lupulus]|uniref:agamous-like MADS-box protein AGL80 n=1 Tax=Humulus lupulus TaxID=3486 RepID=UPI002B4017ED|nr:agamous-like MADS-box protein AGL80 [Humulus lupulus]
MTRKKVKLDYITNDTARKTTFKKRKKGLMKKVSELSTLCDIDACAIMYGPNDNEPEVFPSMEEVHRVIARFHNMSEIEQTKKMVNQEAFLRYRIGKVNEQVKRLKRDNHEKELIQVMYTNLIGNTNLQGLTIQDLNDLTWIIDQSLKDINKRMEQIAKNTKSPYSDG